MIMRPTQVGAMALIALFSFTFDNFVLIHGQERSTKRGEDPWFLEKSAWPQMPYDFGYEIRDLEGNEQYRNEHHDGHRVTGSYGYFGPDGIYRHVDYIADERGFRAQIRTSEPGVSAQNPANVKMIVEPLLPQRVPPPGGRIHRPLGGTGGFDPTVVGDPVLENGLSLPPNRDHSIGNGASGNRLSPVSGSNGGSGESSSSALPSSSGGRPPLIPVEAPLPSSVGGGVRGRPRPIDLGLSHHPSRDPTSRLPGGRPGSGGAGNGGGSSGGPLGGPIDDLFAGRDPHAHRARPGSAGSVGDNRHYAAGGRDGGALDDGIRPNEYLPGELGGRDSLERDLPSRGVGGHLDTKSPPSLAQIPEHDFSKRTDGKNQLGSMEGADSASTGMSNVPDRLSPQSGVSQEEKEDSNRSGSSSDESAKGSTNGGNNLSQGAKGSRGPDGSVSGTGQPARPSVKIFFTEGIATPSAGQASSAVGDSRSTADNRATERESSTNVGNSGEVERVDTRVTNTGGSNSNGVKGGGSQENKNRRHFEPGDAQVSSNLRFDDANERPTKYRARAYAARLNRAYVQPAALRAAAPPSGRRTFARNYQQFRALRNRVPRDRPTVSASEASATIQPKPNRLLEARPFAKLVKDDSLAASLSAPSSAVPLVSVSASAVTSPLQTLLVAPEHGSSFRDRLLGSRIVSLNDRTDSSTTLLKRSGLLSSEDEHQPFATNATNDPVVLLASAANSSTNSDISNKSISIYFNASTEQSDQKLSPGSVTVTSLPVHTNLSSPIKSPKNNEMSKVSSSESLPKSIVLTSNFDQSKSIEISNDDKADSASELHPAFLPYFNLHLPPINEFTSS